MAATPVETTATMKTTTAVEAAAVEAPTEPSVKVASMVNEAKPEADSYG
jgi:hypothetical protein